MSGKFIVLEGVEGVDLEALARRLGAHLRAKGLQESQVYLTREPSDGPIGRDIRLALRGRLQLDNRTLAVLFAADRLDHLQEEQSGIEMHLAKGDWVICDRYYLSQYAFQTYQGFSLDWLRVLNQPCRPPDLIFYIELPLEACVRNYLAQKRQRGFHYTLAPDQKTVEDTKAYLQAIQERYRRVIEELHGENIVQIQVETEQHAIRSITRELDKQGWL